MTEVAAKPALTQVDALTVDILEDAVRVHTGKGLFKYVSYDDFLSIISKQKKASEVKFSSFRLPPNAVHINVADKELKVLCYYPATTRAVLFSNDKYGGRDPVSYKCVWPNLVLKHRLVKDRDKWQPYLTNYYCTELDLSMLPNQEINRGDGIYPAPFANIYESDTLCFGSNAQPRDIPLTDLRALHWYYEILFTSPFNNDLGVRAAPRQADGDYMTPKIWFETLSKLAEEGKPFPYELLRTR